MLNLPLFEKKDLVKLHPVDNKELDQDTIYTVWDIKDDIAEIYIHTEDFNRFPKTKWKVSIHDLIKFNWEIIEEGEVWRFYYKKAPVSQIPKGSMDNQIKSNLFNQHMGRTNFGYMVNALLIVTGKQIRFKSRY